MSSFSVPKKSIEDAMKLLDAIPTRSGTLSSEYIKFSFKDKKHVRMYLSSSLCGEAIVPLSESKGELSLLYLDRRMLQPFVAAGNDLKSEFYVFEPIESGVIVKHGSRRASLASNTSVSGYEKLPDFSKSIHVDIEENWANVANCAILCACYDPIAPQYNCVHVIPEGKRVKVRASDTKLIFQASLSAKTFPCETAIALPLELVAKLSLFGTGICYYTNRWAMVQFPIGRLWQAVKVECHKSFPYQMLSDTVKNILDTGETVLSLGSQSLVEASDRISGYLSSVSRDNPVLKMTATVGAKKAQLHSGTIGADFNESVSLVEKPEQDCIIEWPLSAVLPILKYCKNSGTVSIIKDPLGRTVMKAGNVVLALGPKQDKKKKKRGK